MAVIERLNLKRTVFGYSPADVAAALAELEVQAAAETAQLLHESAAAQRGTDVVRQNLKRLQAQLNQTVDQAQTDLLATLGVQGQDRRHLHAAALDLDARRGLLLDHMLGGEDIATQIRELQARFAAEIRELVASYRVALALSPNDAVPDNHAGLPADRKAVPSPHHSAPGGPDTHSPERK